MAALLDDLRMKFHAFHVLETCSVFCSNQ